MTLLTVSEAAARLNVSERWMRRAIFERRLDVVRLGRLVRIPSDALEAYIDANRNEAQPAAGAGGVVAANARRQARESRGVRCGPDATTTTGGQSRALNTKL